MSGLRLRRYERAGAMLEAVRGLLEADEAANHLPLGILENLAAGASVGGGACSDGRMLATGTRQMAIHAIPNETIGARRTQMIASSPVQSRNRMPGI